MQCKPCPVCWGTKTLDIANRLPGARQEFQCDYCKGEGIVPLVTCRGCGRPAMQWDAQVPYCGREKCWNELVEVVDLAKVRATPRHVGFYPARLLPGVVRNFQGLYWNPFSEDYQDHPVLEGEMYGTRMTPQEEARFHMACRE